MIKTFAFVVYLFLSDGSTVREVQHSGLDAPTCVVLMQITVHFPPPVASGDAAVDNAIVACEEEIGA